MEEKDTQLVESHGFIGKEDKSASYTTRKMFGTRGAMRLRWPPRHILVPLEGEVVSDLVDSTDAQLVVLANLHKHAWLRYLKGGDFVQVMDRLKVPTFVI